jgi:acetolactate synthase small subunit
MALDVRLQDLTGTPISIPWSTGDPHLDSQADAWLYRLPHHKDSALFDLVITPVDRDIWHDLWNLTLVTADVPGIIGRAARLLGGHDINIVSLTSCTTGQGQLHSSTLLINCVGYTSEVDKDSAFRSSHPEATLNQLRRGLAVEFIREVVPPPYPSISIERSIPFWSLYQERLRAGGGAVHVRRVKVANGAINIPRVEVSHIGVHETQVRASRALISVDRSTDLVRVFPFSPHRGIVSLVAVMNNEPGAIAAIAGRMGNSGVNILAAKAWASRDHTRTSLWLLLHDRRNEAVSLADGDVLSRIILLLEDDLKERFDLIVNGQVGGSDGSTEPRREN